MDELLPRQVIEEAAAQLRIRAFLHDDPDAYFAGVRDAISELDGQLDADSASQSPSVEQ